jgi:hypothetical protein
MSQDKPHEGRKEEDAADRHRPAELADPRGAPRMHVYPLALDVL